MKPEHATTPCSGKIFHAVFTMTRGQCLAMVEGVGAKKCSVPTPGIPGEMEHGTNRQESLFPAAQINQIRLGLYSCHALGISL